MRRSSTQYGRTRRSIDFADPLAVIEIATLVIAGVKDPLTPLLSRVERDVAQATRGAAFVQLRDAGHNLPIELAADVATAIERFAK